MNRSEPPCRGFARAAYGLDLSDRSNVYHFPECFMSIRNLDALFKPRSSPSSAPATDRTPSVMPCGRMSARTIVGGGFSVISKYDTVQGARAYRSVADLPETVDLAIVAIPAAAVPAMIEEIAATGTRAVVDHFGGFGETVPPAGPWKPSSSGFARSSKVCASSARTALDFWFPV